MLNILITRYGVEMGILEWDAQAGSFAGFGHSEVEACARVLAAWVAQELGA